MEDWMSSLSYSSKIKPFSQLYLPGSDNACSFNVNESDEVGMDLSKCLRSLASIPLGKETLGRWMKHQYVHLETQLLLGIRYLHIKLSSRDGQFFALNGLYCGLIKDHMHAIHRFLMEHKKEIVILHFTHFSNFTSSDFQSFEKLIEQHFDDLLLRKEEDINNPFNDLSIDDIWKKNNQIICVVDEPFESSSSFIWNEGITKIEPKYESIEKTCKEFEDIIKESEDNENKGLIIFTGVVSLSLFNALQKPYGRYEKEYGRTTTRSLTDWIKKSASNLRPFVLSTHFIDEGKFCQSIIDLNFY